MAFQLADLFELVADAVPDKEAIVDQTRRLTYRQFEERANQLAHYFAAQGIGRGDHVGLYLYNCAEYLEAMLAAMKLGATTININYRYVDDELRYLLDDADIKLLIFQRDLAPIVERVAGDAPKLQHLMFVEDESDQPLGTLKAVEFEQALAGQSSDRDFAPRSNDDQFIVYTGGTTGMPKGVVWRHEDLFFAGLQGGRPQGDPIEAPEDIVDVVQSEEFAINVHPAPPFIHGSSQFAAWIALLGGGKVTIARSRSYDPALTARLITDEGIQVVVLVGDAMCRPLIDEARRNPDAYDFESMFVITSQGAILSRSTQAQLAELFPETMILNNFGASETGHQGMALDTTDDEGRIQFMMNEHTRVLDEDLNEVEPGSGKVGKLARTGHVPLGYYNDTKKTAATFIEHDGKRWVIPGDYATVDEEGLVILLGRGSICINTGGEKVYPEEVEEAIKDNDLVEDVLVVGIPDEHWGERVEAVVELKPGATASAEELATHLRERLAGYKCPKRWHFAEKISRQPSGKPDYKWAKELAQSA